MKFPNLLAMMSASVDFTEAASFQNYIRTYQEQLLSKLFSGFSTGDLITPLEGVKGEKILTEMLLGTLVHRWKKTFDPTVGAIDYKPRTITVSPAKVDLQVYPQEYEEQYLGMSRKPGFKVDDFPFQAFVLGKVFEKMAEEKETAIWTGVKTGSAVTDPLTNLVNGFLKQIADAVTASEITEVSTGALTEADIIDQCEAVHAGLSPAQRRAKTFGFVSLDTYSLYLRAYRDQISKYTKVEQMNGTEMVRLDFAPAWLVPTVGMDVTDKIIFTDPANLYHAYDGANDGDTIMIEKNHRALDLMIDFKFGAGIGIMSNKVLRINDGA
ncbi:MAG TPA: hypothetical protein VFG10_18945 [Saprospiraceae bacterium]|nr:hypothetical protein [Saprospiraceae bacterium]